MADGVLRVGVDGRVMQDRYHGIGRHTFELLRRLALRDVELSVVIDSSRLGRIDVMELARHPNVGLVDLPLPVVSPAAQLALPRLLARTRPDVFLSPYHLAAPVLHPGVPTVTFVHDCIFEADPRFRPGGKGFGIRYRAATRAAIATATTVATISHATRADLERYYGLRLGDATVVPHGVGDEFLVPQEEAPHSVGRYVLHVGVHRPHKDHAVLVEAFAMVARELPDVRLVLVGQPDPRFPVSVPELIRAHGVEDRVDVLAHVDDARLLELYRRASAFAFPSLVEGFGLPVLEAMAAGVPTVTSAHPAVVEAGSGASLVVGRRDPHEWAAALARVLTDRGVAAGMIARGREVAAARSWDDSADRTLALLRAVHEGAMAGRRALGSPPWDVACWSPAETGESGSRSRRRSRQRATRWR
jgi:glycosyltransferase involved in cell wall biosynthesis